MTNEDKMAIAPTDRSMPAVIAAWPSARRLIILTAGIDLSVGAIGILSMLVMANLAANNGVPGVLALLHRHRRRQRLPDAQRSSGDPAEPATVHRHPGHAEHLHRHSACSTPAAKVGRRQMPPILNWTGHAIPIGPFRLTIGVILVVVLAAVMAFVLSQTAWGRHVYAVGDDIEAARLVGIRVDRVLLSVYTVAGSDLRPDRLGADRPGRHRQPERHRRRQPGDASPPW